MRERFVALLHDLTRQIQALDGEEFDKFLAGELKLEIRISEKSRPARRGKRKQLSIGELERLQGALRETDTRERAQELIDDSLHTKEELFQFARVLDIPVPKAAPVGHLKARLIEATVGFRIRSAAVQGKLETSNRSLEPVK